ncbi:hypothetical protein C8R43DRAFT_895395, partial [Mycena crocata]
RHIVMCLRAGRAHDPTGIAGTQPGELAIPCRCCPHPTINLPPGWKTHHLKLRECEFCFSKKRTSAG